MNAKVATDAEAHEKAVEAIHRETEQFRRGANVRIMFVAISASLSLLWADWRLTLACVIASLILEATSKKVGDIGIYYTQRKEYRRTQIVLCSMAFLGTGLNTILPASGFLSHNLVGNHVGEIMFCIMIFTSFVYMSTDRLMLCSSIAPVCALLIVLPIVKFGMGLNAFIYMGVSGFFILAAGSAAVDRNKLIETISQHSRASKQAQQANAAKDQFIATMSHELRTPLNAIIGYSEIMLESAEADKRQIDTEDHKRVLGAGRHLLNMVNQILDLAKSGSGQAEVIVRHFDVEKMLVRTAEAIKPIALENKSSVFLDLQPELGFAETDDLKLSQCLSNLASNAAKFTTEGAIHISACRRVEDETDWLIIEVKDTGIGIAADKIEGLFAPFSQADSSLTRSFGGTGLGLALTRTHARLLGGNVTLVSEQGKGTIATLRVPAAWPAQNAATQLEAADQLREMAA